MLKVTKDEVREEDGTLIAFMSGSDIVIETELTLKDPDEMRQLGEWLLQKSGVSLN